MLIGEEKPAIPEGFGLFLFPKKLFKFSF